MLKASRAKRKINRTTLFSFLIVILILINGIECISFSFKQLSKSLSSNIINVKSTYTFVFYRTANNLGQTTAWNTQAVSSSASIYVTFPSDYALTGTQTCLSLQVISASQTYTITTFNCQISGNNIIFQNALTSVSDLFIKQVTAIYGNVKNPSPAIQTGQFTGFIGTDQAISNGGTSIALQAAAFSSCSVTFGSGGYVNSTSPAIINVTNLNQLNSSSKIKITFPSYKYWINDLSATTLPISTGSMGCSPLTGTLATTSCTGNFSSFTVLASNLFSGIITTGTSFSFQINSFLSPPTLEPLDSIKITSMTNNYEVDTCTIFVTNLQPKPFDNLTIASIQNPMTVNTKVGLTFNMTFSDTVDQDDVFKITFPNSLSVEFTNITTSGSQGNSSLAGKILTVALNPNFLITYWKESFFVINYYSFTAPPSIKQTQSITVEVRRNGYKKLIGSSTLIASPASLTGSVTVESRLVNNNTIYTIQILLNDSLTSSGWLQIIFPSTVKLPSTLNSIVLSGTNMASSPTYVVNTGTNKVTLTALNSSSSNIPIQNFSVSLGMIPNPGTTKPTSTFAISSYYQPGSDYLVATGSILGITPTAGVLSSSDISITKSSDIVLDTSVTYNINFLTTYKIPQNGYVIIEIPSDIGINMASLQSNCFQQINNSSRSASTCSGTFDGSKYTLKFSSVALTGDLSSSAKISLILDSICTNPDTTRNVLGFTISTYSSDAYLIESATTGISLRANTPSTCLNVNLVRVSQQNSFKTNYTITLKQSSNLQAQSYLVFTLPSELLIANDSKCYDSISPSTELVCTIVVNVITIKLSASLVNLTTFGVIITNIYNPATFQPLANSFSLLTKTPDNINKYCQYTSTTSFQNTIPSLFSSLAGAFSPRMYGQLTSLTVTYTPSTRVVPSYLIISLAASLSLQNLTCSYQNIISGACSIISSNTIKITGNMSSNQMQFIINGIVAPKYEQTTVQTTSISSFSSNNYKIDETSQTLNKIQFLVKCTLPCKTCSDTNFTSCLSCYQDTNISTAIYYSSTSNMCYSTCPSGYYNSDSLKTCEKCDSNCLTCSSLSTNCTACISNSTYPYLNVSSSGTCLTSCPSTFYPDTTQTPVVCVKCVTPCNTCSNKTQCLSCLSTFYFYNQTCKNTCPSGITIANSGTNTCDNCSAQCGTCNGTITNCTSCNTNAASYNNTCVTVCPLPLVINNGACANCSTICKTCSIRAGNCTSCNSASAQPFLYQNNCLPTCPSFYYKDVLGGTCQQCALLNIGCKNCTSVSACDSCDSGFVFLNNKCYNFTPTGYYNDNGFAKPCTGDCATCVGLATNCTACKTLNLFDNQCLSNCPSGTVAENKACVSCESPCQTCSNLKTNCTSCIPNLTPKVFLNNYYCTQNCPDYTYANSTTNTCQDCKSPCLQCTSLSTCTSCVNGKYKFNSSCLDTCPTGYVGINKNCEQCESPCSNCSLTKTRCNACISGYFLYNSTSPTCLQDCTTVSLYPDPLTSVCTGCKNPCKTCKNTSTTCTSCVSGYIFFDNQCLTSCPTGYYNSSNSCFVCPTVCRTCSSSDYCFSCKYGFYLLLNYCVQSCPEAYPVITIDGSCSKCSDTACKTCLQNDYCNQCLQPYYLYLGKCVVKCPQNWKQNVSNVTGISQCLYDEAQQSITSSLAGGNLFPVPFSIAGVFICIAILMSKFQNPHTFISGTLFSLIGLLEWGSIIVTLYYFNYSYGYQKIEFYIIAGSLLFLYLLNILAFIIQNIFLCYETTFIKWSSYYRFWYYLVSFASLITTHKFKNIIFCRMFNFSIFKAKLQSVQHFRVFNVFAFLSFLSSGAALFGIALIFSTYQMVANQQLMAYIDTAVLTVLNIIFAIMNSRKQDNFFDQITEEGYIFNKRIYSSDEILHDAIMPLTREEKDEKYNSIMKKTTHYDATSYRNLKSEVSQDSVRNISVQADPLLGQQSRISRLASEDLSQLNFFDKKQVSVQYNQPPVQKLDKSINISRAPQNQISIQMDYIEHHQISIQVQKQKHEISIQYAPNQIDKDIGMSRQEAQISIQANPNHQEVSVQYSAKPIFLNIDQDYDSEIQETVHNLSKSQVKNSQSHIQSTTSYLHPTNKLTQGDQRLQIDLDVDVQDRLRKRQVQEQIRQQRLKQQEKQKMIKDFQNRKQLQNNQEESFEEQPKRKKQINMKNNLNNLFHNNDTRNSGVNQTSLLESQDDILGRNLPNPINTYSQRVNIMSSHQSRVVETDVKDESFGGEKTQQQFIQMLSGRKSEPDSTPNQQPFKTNSQQIQPQISHTKIQQKDEDLLQHQISLNMTQQMQNNQRNFIKSKTNKNYNFQIRNEKMFEDSSDEDQINMGGNQFSKSISTKLISTQRWKPPLPRHLNQDNDFDDSSQNLQNSFSQQTSYLQNDIINGPRQPIGNRISQVQSKPRIYNYSKQEKGLDDPKTNLTEFLQKKSRDLKSAGHGRSKPYSHQFSASDSGSDQQPIQKQQPLALPIDIQFEQTQKISISPLNSQIVEQKPTNLPRGIVFGRRGNSRPKQTVARQVLNPSKGKKTRKQIDVQDELLQRPGRKNDKSQKQDPKRSSVQKIYLNRHGFK